MGLGGRLDRRLGPIGARVGRSARRRPAGARAAGVHAPASAADNLQVPLSHHNIDSTHISSGVLTGGVTYGGAGFEASWFHGREPDENRSSRIPGALDSWAVRASWSSGPWHAQVSGARLAQPERIIRVDQSRLTASIAYACSRRGWPVAALLAWGQKREPFGIFDGYPLEATLGVRARETAYDVARATTKSILGGGIHTPGFRALSSALAHCSPDRGLYARLARDPPRESGRGSRHHGVPRAAEPQRTTARRSRSTCPSGYSGGRGTANPHH